MPSAVADFVNNQTKMINLKPSDSVAEVKIYSE